MPRRTATSRRAKATARSPASIEQAVHMGFDGFAVLEPHLVVAEHLVGFTGPRAVRRRRRRLSRAFSTSSSIAYA